MSCREGRSGIYVLANGRKAYVSLGGSAQALYLPIERRIDLLYAVEQPDQFIEQIRQAQETD